MTMQSFRDECDINNIIARYETTGFLVDPMVASRRTPSFGDFSKLPDYMEAQNIIAVGGEIFACTAMGSIRCCSYIIKTISG